MLRLQFIPKLKEQAVMVESNTSKLAVLFEDGALMLGIADQRSTSTSEHFSFFTEANKMLLYLPTKSDERYNLYLPIGLFLNSTRTYKNASTFSPGKTNSFNSFVPRSHFLLDLY